jgi:glutathione S-transferase
MLTLYFAPGSSSMAPHIALHEIGEPFESHPISFARKETRAPAYLAINPEGVVPTLLIDGRRLTEVAGILFYLAKRFPEARLLPEGDIEAEAQAVSWMSFLASTGASGASARYRSHAHRVRARRAAARRARMGNGPILDRGHSPVPPVLARAAIAQAGAGRVSGPLRPLRAHDGWPAVQKTCAIEASIGYELPA